MAWKNQSGGPWGSGPKGPWGSGPQPVGHRPPDLEDLLRRGQDRLQQMLPGGFFSGIFSGFGGNSDQAAVAPEAVAPMPADKG